MWITIDRTADLPLIRQVYQQIRRQILSGDLAAGDKLPSSRVLAAELQVSRNIILEAYELLFAEGYLASVPGLGTYVAAGAEMREISPEAAAAAANEAGSEETAAPLLNLQCGLPDLRLFPAGKWRRIVMETMNDRADDLWGYDRSEGRPELRGALCDYLRRSRGVICRPEQIIITSGAKQGLSIAARCLLGPGSEAWVEDPNNPNIVRILSLCGAKVRPIPVDGYGLMTSCFPADGRPALVFTTPSHQFPLGGVLPIQRRLDLIKLARERGAYIVEDDYDSEFRYDGAPISSLQELDPGRVVYAGSFSKTLAPALRLGYLVLPPELVDSCRDLKRLDDLFTFPLNQLAAARFIREGHFARHVYRTKLVYRRRRNRFVAALRATFESRVEILGDSAGLHLVAVFKDWEFTEDRMAQLQAAGLDLSPPVERHAMVKGRYSRHLILGYAHLDEAEIQAGVALLGRALRA